MVSLKNNKCPHCTMHKKCLLHKKILGFTLIELVIVVAIAAVIIAAIAIYEDPVKRVGQARDAQRQESLQSLARAIELYETDHGSLPADFATTSLGMDEKFVLCSTPGTLSCGGMTRGCLVVDDQDFLDKIKDLPVDPTKTSTADTGYYVSRTSSDKLVVGACDTYNTAQDIAVVVKATLPGYLPISVPIQRPNCGNGVLDSGEVCDYNSLGSTCLYNPNYYTSGVVYDPAFCTNPVGCSSNCGACLSQCSVGGGGKYVPCESPCTNP